MIKRLRALGGDWTAERIGFGYYRYRGTWLGSSWELQSYAHLAPQFDGDDETFESMFHIYRDGTLFEHPTSDPVFLMRCAAGIEVEL